MKDCFGRDIDYLRLSVTDRCNLRCGYCMPAGPMAGGSDPLSVAEIERVVQALARLGVRRVRLTGGEPLVRPDIVEVARAVSAVDGIGYVALTTNAVRLADRARALRDAGVRGVNISIDALDPSRYRAITGVDALDRALRGLDAAMDAFEDVKVNCVLQGGADWLDVIALARERNISVRLIECMPNAGHAAGNMRVVEALAMLEGRYGHGEPLGEEPDAGPASYWRFEGLRGRVGVIGAMSEHFCDRCNRVRLTSAGVLRTCLFGEGGVDLRALLRGGATENALIGEIEAAIEAKPRDRAAGDIAGMFRIGG